MKRALKLLAALAICAAANMQAAPCFISLDMSEGCPTLISWEGTDGQTYSMNLDAVGTDRYEQFLEKSGCK